MHRLLQRVDGDGVLRGGNGLVGRAAPRQHLEELGVRAEGHAMQAVTLGDGPLVETVFVDLEGLEEVAAIELDGAPQRFLAAAGDERLEDRHVGLDLRLRLVEAEEIAFLDEDLVGGRDLGELAAQTRKRLPQTLPGLFGRRAAPEERGDLVARRALRRLHAQPGEKGLRFFRGDRHQTAGRRADLKIAQKL